MEKNVIGLSAALLLFLSFTPLLIGETLILQYDDDVMDSSSTLAGQAVRFTVPSTGYTCKLESLIIFVQEYGGNQTMTASIWTDDGGDLISAVGSLLFGQEVTVGGYAQYTVDLSGQDITIAPGGSFFGGWTSMDYLMGSWDTSDPDGRTLQKYVGTPWLEAPPDIDAPIRAEISYVLPELTGVSPDSSARGSRLSLVIDSDDAEFSQGGLSTINDVWLLQGGVKILSTGFTPIDSNSLTASFDLPVDAALGDWDVYVDSAIFGQMQPLAKAFTIFASPDLNRDGKVDINDYCFFSKHWQEEIIKIPINVLIPAGQFEMGSHFPEGGSDELPLHTVTVDEFYMSNFEITNQQYCYFLNSAVSKGQLQVVSNVVYASDDAANSYPYFTCNAGLSQSQIEYSDSVFTIGGGKSRDTTDDPVVAVSWYGAAAYCNWRSAKEGKDACYDTSTWVCDFAKNGYHLPTEAQWEYAARGSKYAPYLRFEWGGTISHNEANYFGDIQYTYNAIGSEGYHPDYVDSVEPYTAPAGSFAANDYGLYEMTGNVWEWCNDWYDPSYYSSGENNNPTGPAAGTFVVMRGGSWKNTPNLCRTAKRNFNYPITIGSYTGFRVCIRP